MKKSAASILEKIRTFILSDEFKERHKKSDKWFTRNRIFGFYITISLMLNLLRRTLQIEIYSLFDEIDTVHASKQSFCNARKKISHEAFIEINDLLVSEFYTDNDGVKLFAGFIVLAIDGSTLLLPESLSIRETFGACSNGIIKDHIPMARISHVYDVINGIILHASINPYKSSERDMAMEHIRKISVLDSFFNTLILFDRGYPSITLFFFCKEHKKEFLMRCALTFLPGFAQQKIKDGERDFIIELRAKKLKGKDRKKFQELLPNVHITSTIQLRVLVIELDNNEKEYLITTLLDSEKFTYEMFKDLYNKRWGIEENYKFLKVKIEIENFSTKTPSGIEQEFYGTIFMSNVKELLIHEAQEASDQEKINHNNKHEYIINQNIAIGLLKTSLILVLFDKERNIEQFCEKVKFLMKKNTVPIRKGRTFPRKVKAKRKHHMTIRRSL